MTASEAGGGGTQEHDLTGSAPLQVSFLLRLSGATDLLRGVMCYCGFSLQKTVLMLLKHVATVQNSCAQTLLGSKGTAVLRLQIRYAFRKLSDQCSTMGNHESLTKDSITGL